MPSDPAPMTLGNMRARSRRINKCGPIVKAVLSPYRDQVASH